MDYSYYSAASSNYEHNWYVAEFMTDEFERRLKTIRGYKVLTKWGPAKVKQIFWPERRALITLDLGSVYRTSVGDYASIEFEADGSESIMCDLSDLKPLKTP